MGTTKKTAEANKKKLFLLFLNIGKLVLGTIIRGGISQSALLNAGVIASIVGTIIGVTLITLYEDK